MSKAAAMFGDAAQYHDFMARGTIAAGVRFLDWLEPPRNAAWLDVGCGTGLFTQLAAGRCAVKSIAGIDAAASQVARANGLPIAAPATFSVADAQNLPFSDGSFDVAVSALVLNFIPDPRAAVAQMTRVVRAGGIVAGYVWDLAGGLSPTWPLATALKAAGFSPRESVGREHTNIDELRAMFGAAGLQGVETAAFDIELAFPDFDTYWSTQTPTFHPFGKMISAMDDGQRDRVKTLVRQSLRIGHSGEIVSTARANAVKSTRR